MSDATENFRSAVAKLEEFSREDPESELARTALILAFAFSFETAWKHLRRRLVEEGEAPKSPRDTLVLALANGLIPSEAEEDWLVMLNDRNLVVHSYSEDLAEQLSERIRGRHLPRLRELIASS